MDTTDHDRERRKKKRRNRQRQREEEIFLWCMVTGLWALVIYVCIAAWPTGG